MADCTRLPQGIHIEGSPAITRPLDTLVRSSVSGALIASTNPAAPAYENVPAGALVEGGGTRLDLGALADGMGYVRDGFDLVSASTSPSEGDTVVYCAPSGAKYWTIGSAVTAAGALATPTHRVTVIVSPGEYYESNPMVLPANVTIFCPGGCRSTRFWCLDANQDGIVFTPAANTASQIIGLQVRGATGLNCAAFRFPDGVHNAELDMCRFADCYYGVHSQASGGPETAIYARQFSTWTGTCNTAYICSAGGFLAMEATAAGGGMTCGTFFKADGAGSYLVAHLCSLDGSNTVRLGEVSNTGTLELKSMRMDGCDEGIFVLGTGGTTYLDGVQVTNCPGAQINLANAATVSCIATDCYLDTGTFVLGALAAFTGNYQCYSVSAGPTVIGELWLGITPAEQVPVSTYLRDTACTGWVSGGGVSTNAGRVLDVALGTGLVNTGTGVVVVNWGGTTVTADPNSIFWVYVTSAAVVSIATVQPDERTNIILATGYANANNIVFVACHRIDVNRLISKRHEYIAGVIGAIWQSGLATTLPGLLKLNVGSGTFYRDERLTTATGATPITFTSWYNNGAWVPTLAVADIDHDQMNTFGGSRRPSGSRLAATAPSSTSSTRRRPTRTKGLRKRLPCRCPRRSS
jgi:hypothetical protein